MVADPFEQQAAEIDGMKALILKVRGPITLEGLKALVGRYPAYPRIKIFTFQDGATEPDQARYDWTEAGGFSRTKTEFDGVTAKPP